MVIVKLKIEREIRRIGNAPSSLEVLKKKAKEFFCIENPCFLYTDPDGEKVMFDSQDEYLDVLKLNIDPLILWVEDSDLVKLSRSTIISQILPIEPKPKLSLTSPYTISLNSSGLLNSSKILKKPEKIHQSSGFNRASVDVQTDCSCLDVQEKQIECNDKISLESVLNKVKKILNIQQANHMFMGVRCSGCNQEIFDLVYKCNECSGLFLCKYCECDNEHLHTLVKSRFRVCGIKVETSGGNDKFKIKTQGEDFSKLKSKSEIFEIRKKTFN